MTETTTTGSAAAQSVGLSAGPAAGPSIGLAGAPAMPTIATPAGDPVPQGASAELLARPRLPGQVTITITSSKGGSGKSTTAILLAGAIARASREAGRPLSVCLVDMDTRDGQVASMIGRYMPTALNIRVQPVWDEATIRRHLVRDDTFGIDTLLAPIRPRTADAVGPDFYRVIVASLQRMYDVVVMDTSVQYLDPLIATVCLPIADEIVFVTTLASTAVQGMARALREITSPVEESGMGIDRSKIGIVVNQSVADVGMEREQITVAGLGVPIVGAIPLATRDVLTAMNHTQMDKLLDHSLLGPAFADLAIACLPRRELKTWIAERPRPASEVARAAVPSGVGAAAVPGFAATAEPGERRKGLFRR